MRLLYNLRSRRGFSLIEALLSIVMMTAIVLALLGIIPYGFDEIQVNATQVQATALGQQYLDALRNAKQSKNPLPTATTAPVDQGDSFATGSTNTSSSTFNIAPNSCPVVTAGATASQYDCAVTVTWTENGQNESVKVETYVTM
jgi:Tfp pilus assembly protein PilV